jgi:hypothetical protein
MRCGETRERSRETNSSVSLCDSWTMLDSGVGLYAGRGEPRPYKE